MAKKSRNLFAKFELDYADHPKIMVLSDAAFRLHVTLILHSRKYETDGIIKNPVGLRFANQFGFDVFSELENNDTDRPSLQKQPNGDWVLNGFTDIQETKAEIQARTRQNRENGAKGGRPKKTQSVSQSVSESDSEPQTNSAPQKKAEIEIELNTSYASAKSDFKRPDVEKILNEFDAYTERLGAKPAPRTKRNRDAIQMLIDLDGYTPEQITWIIRWVSNDDFWKTVILTPAKLREKFEQLKVKATNSPKPQAQSFNGDIDPDAILGRDYWTCPAPPDGLTVAEEIAWKREAREKHLAERHEQARQKLKEHNNATAA